MRQRKLIDNKKRYNDKPQTMVRLVALGRPWSRGGLQGPGGTGNVTTLSTSDHCQHPASTTQTHSARINTSKSPAQRGCRAIHKVGRLCVNKSSQQKYVMCHAQIDRKISRLSADKDGKCSTFGDSVSKILAYRSSDFVFVAMPTVCNKR